jgi:hypothetical protein
VADEVSARTAWAACVAIGALGLAAELARVAPPDIGFFLYAAGRLLDGARLYRDVVDLNPPLIFAVNMPVMRLARLTGLSEFLLYRLCSALLLGMLLLYSGRLLLRYVFPDRAVRARYVLLLFCFALFLLVRSDFGQREHFVLALLLPYVLLVAADCARRRPPAGEAVVIGLMAGAAIGFKPHFGLVWIVLEGFRRVHLPRGRPWRPTPEAVGVAGFLVIYGAAVYWLTPNYLSLAAFLGPAYLKYRRQPFIDLLVVGPEAALVEFVLLALLALRRRMRTPTFGTLLAWTTVACLAAGAAQGKDFPYHFYPALGLAFVLLGLLAADARDAKGPLSVRMYGRVSRALLGTMLTVVLAGSALDTMGGNVGQQRQRVALAELARAVQVRAGGRSVGMLSYTLLSAFPLVNLAHVHLATRFPGFWLLASSYWDAIATGGPLRYHAVDEMAPPERYFLNAVREDLTMAQPRLLLVLRPARDAAINRQRRLQYIEYFNRDPDLAALLAQYRLVDQQGDFLLYERGEPGADSTGPPPSPAPGTEDVIRTRPAEFRLASLNQESLVVLAVFVACWLSLGLIDRRRAAP